MEKVREDLEKFRAKKLEEKRAEGEKQQARSQDDVYQVRERVPSVWTRLFDFDFFDVWPLRVWRRLYDMYPLPTLVSSLAFYSIGQVLANKAEFGIIFFMWSILTAIILSLGTRRSDEVSAYSVFNPGCERLPGQMTAEHFERDVLLRRR